jgi:hypothetical protein
MREVQFTPTPRILRGLGEIAAYLKVSPRTVRRWIDKYGLFAIRGPSAGYMTTTGLLDLWMLAVWEQEQELRQAGKDIEPIKADRQAD